MRLSIIPIIPITILMCGLLSACHSYPQGEFNIMEKQFTTSCINAGNVDQSQEFKECVDKSWSEYNKAKNAELEREAKERKKLQITADKATCKEYGLTYGTKDFADCMIKLDQVRQNQQIQEKLAQRQAEIRRRQAMAAAMEDMSAGMQSMGNAYTNAGNAYGNAAYQQQNNIQPGQQMVDQARADQQQRQQQQQMDDIQQQIKKQQQEIDNERKDPLGGLNGRWH